MLDRKFDSNIYVGDMLEYENDGVKRKVTGKSFVDGNLIITFDQPISGYKMIDYILRSRMGGTYQYIYLWKGNSDFSFNFGLMPQSAAIDSGAGAQGTAEDDIKGVLRPQGSAWDIGAKPL